MKSVSASLLALAFAASAHATCAGVVLPLESERTGHVAVHVELNGIKVRMLVDTGANVSTLDEESAKQLQIFGRDWKPDDSHEHKSVKVAVAGSALGSTAVAVMDLSFINMPTKARGTEPFAGQLGAAFFRERSAIIDFATMELCVKAP